MLAASAGQRAGTLLSTLFFVHVAGAHEFAAIVPLLPVAPVVNTACLLGQDQSMLRFLLSGRGRALDIRSSVAVGGIVCAAGLLTGTLISVIVALAIDVPLQAAALSAFGGVLLGLAQATSIARARADRNASAYFSVYAVYGVIAVAVRAIAYETGLDGVYAWAVGDALAGAATLITALALVRPNSSTQASYDIREGLGYGLPLLPHAFAQQALANADRWILPGRVSASQLSLYVAAYQFASIVNIVLSEVNRSRQDRYVGIEVEGARRLERRERGLLFGVVAVLATPVAVVAALLSGGNTQEGFIVTLAICASFASLALYLPLANRLSLTVGRTVSLARASVAGALTNVTLNLALVPTLGIWAAVLANFAGYLAMFVVLRVGRAHE